MQVVCINLLILGYDNFREVIIQSFRRRVLFEHRVYMKFSVYNILLFILTMFLRVSMIVAYRLCNQLVYSMSIFMYADDVILLLPMCLLCSAFCSL